MPATDSLLPPLPAGLTADWLTQVLHQAGLPRDARISAVQRSSVGDGVGMMSELSRLSLTWSKPSPALPATIIAKYASTNPMNRAAAMSFHVYEREVRFFLEADAQTSAHTPHFYFAKMQDEHYLLLMDDLDTHRVGSQAAGASLEDAALAIDELAKLHAPFWDNVGEFDWVPHIANSYHATSMATFANDGWDNMAHVFGDHLPESIRQRRDDILAAIPALQTRMDQRPITLIHGDYRLDNMLFGTKPEHDPVVIIDWQGPMRCKGIVDVALLLGQNAHIEVRRAHEHTLIRRYVDGLSALGVSYPFDQAWDDYLDALLYQWCYASTVTGTLDSTNPRSSAWMSQLVARQSAATLDHQLLTRLERFV